MRTITLAILACCTMTIPTWAITCGDILSGGRALSS